MEISNTKDVTKVNRSYLVFGASKTGKTQLVTTLPQGKALLINVENNLDSIAGADVMKVDCFDMKKWDEIIAFLQANGPPEWVFVDSISALLQKAFNEEFTKTKDGRAAYSAVERCYYDVIADIKTLPCNIVCVGQMGKIKDEITGGMIFGASLPWAKLEHNLPYNFSVVVASRTEKDAEGKTHYYLQCHPDSQYAVGARTNYGEPNPLDFYEPADLMNLHNKITGKITTKKEGE